MNYDLILEELGEFGTWQILIAAILWLPAAVDGIQILMLSFTGLQPDKYRCKIDGIDSDNFQFGDFTEDLFPENEKGDGKDYCKYYQPVLLENGSFTFDNSSVHSCEGDVDYTFESFEMDNTIITDFNLYCDKNIQIPFGNSFFMIGLMIGSFLFGVLSDKFGRKHTLLLAIVTCGGGSLVGSFMPNYYGYVACRMIAAMGAEGCFLIPFSFSMEIVGIQEKLRFLPWVTYNTFLANIISVPLAGGETLISILAIYLHEWSTLQWVSSTICLAVGVIWLFLPESPRWLIANGRFEEAKTVIRSAAKRNGTKVSEETLAGGRQDQDTEKGEKEKEENNVQDNSDYSIKDLFHPEIRLITLVMFICWPVVTLLYYGISFSVDKVELTDDVFLSNILISLIEIPSYIFLVISMDVWGRKPLFVLTMLIPGVACIVAAFLEGGILFTILVLIGKFCIAAAFNITYMYTAELYPTVIRNTAIGCCSTMARFGGILAPWIAVYFPDQGSLPDFVAYTVFGVSSLIGGTLALLLPETLGAPLPDNFQDLQNMKKNSKPMWKCVCTTNKKEDN